MVGRGFLVVQAGLAKGVSRVSDWGFGNRGASETYLGDYKAHPDTENAVKLW